MRTATTIAVTHDGKDELIFGPTEPMEIQRQAFRKTRGNRSHEKFALVYYQESDTPAQIHRLHSPDSMKAHDTARASEKKANKDFLAKLKKDGEEGKSVAKVKEEKAHTEAVAKHSENINKIVATQALNESEAVTLRNARKNRGQKPAIPPAPAVKGTLENPHIGDADPADDFGKDGEFFGNQKTSTLFAKEAGKWTVVEGPKE